MRNCPKYFLFLLAFLLFSVVAHSEESASEKRQREHNEEIRAIIRKENTLTSEQQKEYREIFKAFRAADYAKAKKLLDAMKPKNYLNKMRRLYLQSVVMLLISDYAKSYELLSQFCELTKEPGNRVTQYGHSPYFFRKSEFTHLKEYLSEFIPSENKPVRFPHPDLNTERPVFFNEDGLLSDEGMFILYLFKGRKYIKDHYNSLRKHGIEIDSASLKNLEYTRQEVKKFGRIRGSEYLSNTTLFCIPGSMGCVLVKEEKMPDVTEVLNLYRKKVLIPKGWLAEKSDNTSVEKGSLLDSFLVKSNEIAPLCSGLWDEYHYLVTLQWRLGIVEKIASTDEDCLKKFEQARVELSKTFPFEALFLLPGSDFALELERYTELMLKFSRICSALRKKAKQE